MLRTMLFCPRRADPQELFSLIAISFSGVKSLRIWVIMKGLGRWISAPSG